ncbi:MAG: helix-turn-helix domain-containing protein [Verrucomicrobiota bacterium]
MNGSSPHLRFREARESARLSIGELANASGFTTASIYDIEQYESDLTCCYSPAELKKLCAPLRIKSSDLFGDPLFESSVSAEELARMIENECRVRNLSLQEFGKIVGWDLEASMTPSEKLLSDLTIDAMQWLCRELRIDWRRVL